MKKEESKEKSKEEEKKEETKEEEKKEEQPEIENAPPLLKLEPHEKFHDTDGEILEIETRGRRHVDEIFFRVRDVMKRFDMPNLKRALLKDAEAGYERGLHFITFTVVNAVHHSKSNTKKPVKSLFLTYHGVMRVLIVSRNKNMYYLLFIKNYKREKRGREKREGRERK